MIKRLIFDIDGTLITGVSFSEAINKSLMEYGIFSEKNVQNFIKAISTYESHYNGYKQDDYLKYFSNVLGCELGSSFLDIFFNNLGVYSIPANNERLMATIEMLSQKYELVLLSNYFEKSQRNRLEKMGINKYFSEYYGEKVSKPDRMAYINSIGVHKPEECVMIGDSLELDIKGAKRYGINTIWINNRKVPQYDVRTVSVEDVTNINEKLINSLEKDFGER